MRLFNTIIVLIAGFLAGHLSRSDYDTLRKVCPFVAEKEYTTDEAFINLLNHQYKITVEKRHP